MSPPEVEKDTPHTKEDLIGREIFLQNMMKDAAKNNFSFTCHTHAAAMGS